VNIVIKTTITAVTIFLSTLTYAADPIVTDSTSNSTTNSTSKSETTVKSPPPTAVAPAVTTINNDVCATAASGAVQTQILGISMGGTTRDMNCERIKLSKNLYDMGMKVAAVATLCQDERVFQAMIDAGTPCPVMGKIGEQAKEIWTSRGRVKPEDQNKPQPVEPATGVVTPVKNTPLATVNPLCPGYAGNDPIVKQRLGCE
jgi:hypothetical protein